jgi:hypothetical protein
MWPARATVGRQPSRRACHLGGFFAFTTRFLIGTGGLLTTAFVGDARAFIRRNEAPLLAAPPRTSIRHVWDDTPYRPICAGAKQHALLADQLNGLIEPAPQ